MQLETKVYKNAWHLEDMRNIDDAIYNMIYAGLQQRSKYYPNKQLMAQYITFVYLAGARRIEPFLKPPTIAMSRIEGMRVIKVTKAIAKHFTASTLRCMECGLIMSGRDSQKKHKRSTKPEHKTFTHISGRKTASHTFVPLNESELALWSFLLQGRNQVTLDFGPLMPKQFRELPRDDRRDALEKYMSDRANPDMFASLSAQASRMLRGNIASEGKTMKDTTIPLHLLRHLRAYDLWVVHRFKDTTVQKLLDWDSRAMLDHYADIKEAIGAIEEQEQVIREVQEMRKSQKPSF